MARHRRPPNRHLPRLPQSTLLTGSLVAVVTAAVLGVTAFVTRPWGQHPAPARSPGTHQPNRAPLVQPDVLPRTPGATPCTSLRVRTSLENAELVRRLAQAYQGSRRDVDGHCVELAVTSDASGLTASDVEGDFASTPAADRPELWIPDSSAWPAIVAVRRAARGQPPVIPARSASVALSYLVLGMPSTLAEAIGWRSDPPTWGQFLATAADRDSWRSKGHPEYGDFKLGKTSPTVASSGLYALVAEYGASANKLKSLAVSDIAVPTYRTSVTAFERSTVHYMSTEPHLLWHVRQSDDSGNAAGFLSVLPVTERALWEYNRGVVSNDGVTYTQLSPPHQPLVPVYPEDGTYAFDNPGVVLDAPWVSTPERAAARDFLRFATTREGQAVARQSGYRDISGRADSDVATVGHYADADKVRILPSPSGQLLATVQDSFPAVRKRARVLFLVDVSESMNTPVAPGVTRLQAAQRAIASALTYFTNDDQVGLAAFSNISGRRSIVPGLVTPVAPLGTNRSTLLAGLQTLRPIKATPLYAAVQQYTSAMASGYRPDWINAVVLLSDGRNESLAFPDTLGSMSAAVTGTTATHPILIFTLAFGQQADVPTLKAISKLTHAHFYDASDPTHVQRVLGDLVTSF